MEDKFFDRQEAAAQELGDQDAAHTNLFCWIAKAQAEAPASRMLRCGGPLPSFHITVASEQNKAC